jgi:multisubunit Na+/H+ antiporter MnhC subunit
MVRREGVHERTPSFFVVRIQESGVESMSSQLGATTSLLVFGSIVICVATVAVILLVLITMRLNRRRLVDEDEDNEPSAQA